jgi:HD-GYP domain-containing protein (c-di-GMP phosphodiesterase class II)
MRAERGNHFDPVLLDAFIENYDEFIAIANLHRDPSLSNETRNTSSGLST